MTTGRSALLRWSCPSAFLILSESACPGRAQSCFRRSEGGKRCGRQTATAVCRDRLGKWQAAQHFHGSWGKFAHGAGARADADRFFLYHRKVPDLYGQSKYSRRFCSRSFCDRAIPSGGRSAKRVSACLSGLRERAVDRFFGHFRLCLKRNPG